MLEIRSARSEREADDGYELASRTFGPDYFTASEAQSLARRLDPIEDLRDVVVAVQGSEVVGFVRILDREVWLGETSLKVGGIASVTLRPDFRGHDYGRAIVEAALDRLYEKKDVLSVVFARRAVDGFYSRFGFVGVGIHPEMVVTITMDGDTPREDLKVTRGFDERMLKWYSLAYDESYQGLVLSFRRSRSWWEKASLLVASRTGVEQFVTVMDRDQPVGYFVVYQGKIIEVASRADARRHMILALRALATEKGNELHVALPLGHWALQVFRGMNHTLKVRMSWDGGHMLRVLAPNVLFAALRAHGAADGLGQFDADDHQMARTVILHLAGVSGVSPVGGTTVAGPGEWPLLPQLPSWSFIDEF